MFSSLEDIWTKTDIFTLNYDLGLECGNKILSQDTLAYDDISTDQVSLQKSKQFMRYSRDKKKLKIDHISLCCDLDLEIAHNAASPYHVW